jgi:hypothetical protein
MTAPHRLRPILGDRLQHDSPQLQQFDPVSDRMVTIEAPGDACPESQGPHRTAPRGHAPLRRGIARPRLLLDYVELDDPASAAHPGLLERLGQRLHAGGAQELAIVEPGDWRACVGRSSACANALE